MLEPTIKIIIILSLLVAAFCYLLLPRSKFSEKIKMTEPLFVATNIVGISCGIIGVIALFLISENIIELHLWELIVLPYVMVWIYWLVIIRLRRTSTIVDEKQEFDMSKAAGSTMAGTIIILAIMFMLSTSNIYQLGGGLWFPFYLFITITLFSFFTLLYFKKN